jgi:hypothetical protein
MTAFAFMTSQGPNFIITCISLQEADMEFASSLISLRKTIKRGIQVHEDFSGGVMSPAELLVCHFKGIKVNCKHIFLASSLKI